MNDREYRRYDMFTRVQTFGKERNADFPAGSKAAGHFAALSQVITDLEAAKASQGRGRATAKAVLLDALRLDLQDIARTARAIDAEKPGFAHPYRLADSNSQAGLLTAADAILIELAKPGVAKLFLAYDLPRNFVADLKADVEAIRLADAVKDSDDQEGVASIVAVGKLIKSGMAAVTQLNAIVRNKFKRNAIVLRAWANASHIERSPQREKKDDGETPTPPSA
jgi:hypothetical protein